MIPVFGAVVRGHVWTVYRTLVYSLEMISRGLKRTQTLLEKSRVVIPVFGAVVRGHVWTVQRQPLEPPEAFSSIPCPALPLYFEGTSKLDIE